MTPDDRTNDLTWSKEVSQHLSDEDASNVEYKQQKSIKSIKKQKTEILKSKIDSLQMTLEANQQYSMALASEKGASSWLTALPLKRYGFDLTKTEFRDGLSLRYGLQPKNLPSKCSCGEDFTVSHALHCGKGGYTHMRHNEIRDTFAKIMRDVCYDVEIEPKLQALEGESFDHRTTCTEDEARLDIKASGIWDSRFCRTFFDVKIFNPHAASCPRNIKDAYKNTKVRKIEI